jgi:hypothetical protein
MSDLTAEAFAGVRAAQLALPAIAANLPAPLKEMQD